MSQARGEPVAPSAPLPGVRTHLSVGREAHLFARRAEELMAELTNSTSRRHPRSRRRPPVSAVGRRTRHGRSTHLTRTELRLDTPPDARSGTARGRSRTRPALIHHHFGERFIQRAPGAMGSRPAGIAIAGTARRRAETCPRALYSARTSAQRSARGPGPRTNRKVATPQPIVVGS